MGIGTQVLGIIAFAGAGALSYSAFSVYAEAPDIKDVDLIRQSAKNLADTISLMDKQGDGYLTSENSTMPLTYALERMAIVQQDNPDLAEDIGKLVSPLEAVKASKEIMADPLLYRTALLGLKTDLSEYAAGDKDGGLVVCGIFFAILALLGAGMTISDYRDEHY